MSKAARHKQKARKHEQREDWQRAIDEYERAIEVGKEKGDVDIALYNRVGDLYRRIGDVGKAVSYYEAAADAHMEAGFYNNAIALCNKILRTMPNRYSVHLKLGKIGAAKGFLSDARKHFLEYAEHMQRAGQLEKAFDALREFADISPDPEIRLMIADQLLDHDLQDQAVDQLRLAWRDLQNDGREADALDVRERILEMAPERDPETDPPAAEESTVGVDAEGVIDLPEIELFPAADTSDEASAQVEPTEIVPTSLGEEPDEVEPEKPASPMEDLEIVPTALPEERPEVDVGSAEAPVSEAESEPEAERTIDADVSVGEGLPEPEELPEVEDLPEIEEPVEAEEVTEVAAVATPEERIAELRARLRDSKAGPRLKVELAEALLETGERVEATRHLREAVEIYDRRGEIREALHVAGELLYLNRNDVRAYQKRVEIALRAGDRNALLEAYLDLADCLDRTDASNKARIVYARVLELDPDNQRARAALEMVDAGEPAAGDGTASEYAELTALFAEEEKEGVSTRFRLPAQEPQSEEEVNFAAMLDQFKSKVAESIEEQDAESHYDLGVAFKEMGLLDEAIAEFQIAARTREYRLRAMEMLGACFLEKGNHRIALKVLSRVLKSPDFDEEELVGIIYGMGRAHEALGEQEEALQFYERVMGCDIHFADVANRVAALRG